MVEAYLEGIAKLYMCDGVSSGAGGHHVSKLRPRLTSRKDQLQGFAKERMGLSRARPTMRVQCSIVGDSTGIMVGHV